MSYMMGSVVLESLKEEMLSSSERMQEMMAKLRKN